MKRGGNRRLIRKNTERANRSRSWPGLRRLETPENEIILRADEKLRKHSDLYGVVNKMGSVMDIVVALLALISVGVFAAHTLEAWRAD